MLLAVSTMDPTVRMIFFAAAVVAFALSAFSYERGRMSFVPAGLALFVFPSFWDALAAT
jgi:hypothetical protein